jgi:hypothetical protein
MGKNGRHVAENVFSWDKIAETTEQCYRS